MEIHPTSSFDSTWEEAGSLSPEDNEPSPGTAHDAGDQGPCLFLGSNGERCSRPAIDGGFCGHHQPGRKGIQRLASEANVPSRAFAAVVTIGVLLWPYIADAVRELLRWLAAR